MLDVFGNALLPEFVHWDIIVIAIIAVIAMIALSVWGLRKRIRFFYIFLLWIPFLLLLFAGSQRAAHEENIHHELWISNLTGITRMFAATTENLKHAQIQNPDQETYQNILSLHKQWCADIPYVTRVYTLRRQPGTADKTYWVVSCPSDVNKDEKIEGPNEVGKHYKQINDKWLPIYQRAFDDEVAIDESVNDVSRGDFIIIAAPLHDQRISDSQGHPYIEAILVVEFYENRWNARARQVRSVLMCFLAVLLGTYVIIFGSFLSLVSASQKLRQANDSIVVAHNMAESAAKSKSDFLAGMTNEILPPLSAVVSFADILTQRIGRHSSVEVEEELEGILDIIRANSHKLTTVVSDVVDYAKIEANLLQIESIPVSIRQVVDDVVQMVKPNIADKNLDFIVHVKSDTPSLILADPVRLRQIMTTIITNSVANTDRGSISILVETKSPTTDFSAVLKKGKPNANAQPTIQYDSDVYGTKTMLQIEIIDTGLVVPEFHDSAVTGDDDNGEHKQIIKRTVPKKLHELSDTGLGLSVARRLATLMDGVIFVSSDICSGTVFTFLLNVYIPQNIQHAEEARSVFESGKDHQGSQLGPGLEIRAPHGAGSEILPRTDSKEVLKQVRVLLVEDIVVNQLVIATQLREAGAILDIADNGDVAIKRINDNMDNGIYFDIILMDMRMPVMDGYDATKQLRDQGYDRPIIAITAHAALGDREKCLEAGCNDYIPKPVDRRTMIETIQKHLHSHWSGN